MDPNNAKDLARLRSAMEFSRRKLRPFRENRLEAIRQFVGSHYGEDGTKEKVPLMFLEMAVSIYTQQLVGGPPRGFVRTKHRDLKAAAADLKIALDHTVDEIHLEDTLVRLTQDALFGPAIVKIGLTEGEVGESQGWWHDQWQPFVDHVDLDDWVHDMTAKTWERVAFCGNRYRVPSEVAKRSELFDRKMRKALQPTSKRSTNEDGDERADSLTGGEEADLDEYQDYVELWDLWLPQEGIIVTISADQELPKPLRVVEWKGPEGGPYLMLGFSPVPSNIMPLPPVAVWKDLHDIANSVYRKLSKQAARQKSILPIRNGNPDDGDAIRDAGDGDIIPVEGEVPKEVRFGGPDQVNLAFLLSVNDMFNRQAGNLDTLGGLSPQADTLGQEQILGANASQRIVFMRRRLNTFVSQILNQLAFYLFDDPFVDMDLEKPIRGTSATVGFSWNPDTREGDLREYNITIEPYSMVYKSPQTQLNAIMQLLQTVVLPLAPMMQAQGIAINFEKILRTLAEYADITELSDFLSFDTPVMDRGPVGGPGDLRQSPVTTRRYERTNRPGAARGQKENALMQTLLGNMPQPSEAATMGRSVG